MKIKRFFMSYNPDSVKDFETLKKYVKLIAKPKALWSDHLIPSAAKCISTNIGWRKFQDFLKRDRGNREFTEQEELEAHDELRRIYLEMSGYQPADEHEPPEDDDIIWIECPEERENKENLGSIGYR
ncbi:hypothetical protein BpHYR1_052190 [Brachionus plicatilis]|uniref:Uncharacterized protein n=1 Tax=Brachionus plicatilis TaxID=10195 RepID=A0A3M7S444_BRAPC|nr:hypothetical protein BpHYR1_052190 [Brachionus plicatilis]